MTDRDRNYDASRATLGDDRGRPGEGRQGMGENRNFSEQGRGGQGFGRDDGRSNGPGGAPGYGAYSEAGQGWRSTSNRQSGGEGDTGAGYGSQGGFGSQWGRAGYGDIAHGSSYNTDGAEWGARGDGGRNEGRGYEERGGSRGGGSYGQGDYDRSSQRSTYRETTGYGAGAPNFGDDSRNRADPGRTTGASFGGGSNADRFDAVRQGERHEHDHDPHYSAWRARQLDTHDQDYRRWRDAQAKRYDEEYGKWRGERHDAFSRDFGDWRSKNADARSRTDSAALTGEASRSTDAQVQNVADGGAGHVKDEDTTSGA